MKKIPKQINQLHSTLEKTRSVLGFLEAPQEMLHQFWELVELGGITYLSLVTHIFLVPFHPKKEKEKVNSPSRR